MDGGRTYTNGPENKKTNDDALHPGNNVDRLYVSRKEGRALASIEDSVDASIQRLHKKAGRKTDYSDLKQYRQYKHQQNKNNKKAKNGKKNNCMYTHMYGNLTWENLDMAMKRETSRRETESLRIAAQSNAINPNYVKDILSIDKTQQNSKCRLKNAW